MATRYYRIDGPPNLLAKSEPGGVCLWRDGKWERSAWAYHKVSGYGGDADAHEITEADAIAFIEASKGGP